MPRAEHVPLLAFAGIAVLVVWRVFVRVRRLVGRQPLRRVRAWITVCAFPLLLIGLAFSALQHPWSAVAEAAGVAIGVALGVAGLQRTKFEVTPAGLFYTPSAHIGIALSLLLVGRLAWRAAQFYLHSEVIMAPPADFARSPLTMLIVGTTAGYYASYAFGLLRWRARVLAAPGPVPIESA
jgi:hypothetical protein